MSLNHFHVRDATLSDSTVIAALVSQLGYATAAADMKRRRITGLVVVARWRGRGIGRLLMNHMERWCKNRGAHSLILTSGNHRVDAHKFYAAIGYNATGLRFIKRL